MLNLENLKSYLVSAGFSVSEDPSRLLSGFCASARLELGPCGLHVLIGENGCVRVTKPNGSIKWFCGQSDAQVRAALEKVIEFWRR